MISLSLYTYICTYSIYSYHSTAGHHSVIYVLQLVSVLRIWDSFCFFGAEDFPQDAKQKPFSPVVPLPPQPPPAEVAAPRLLGSPRRLRPVPQRPRQRHSLREAPKLGGLMSASLKFQLWSWFFLVYFFGLGLFWSPRGWMSYHYSNFHWDGKILDITNLKIIEYYN